MSGFGGASERAIMRDTMIYPGYRERMVRASRGEDAINLLAAPRAIGEVRYTRPELLHAECAELAAILDDLGAGPGDAFMSAPSPGIIAAAVGGTVSELGGGKFANGALTGAYGYLFNYHLSRNNEQVGERFDRSRWNRQSTLWEANTSHTFVAGDRIAVQAWSDALTPPHQFDFTVLAVGMNANGTVQSSLSTEYWSGPQSYSVTTGGLYMPQRVFESDLHSPVVQWTVSIPLQTGTPHGNTAGPTLNISTPYDPWKQ